MRPDTPSVLLVFCQGVPLLVLANKMDLPSAAQPCEIAEKLQLPAVSSSRSFHITGCSALENKGIMVSNTRVLCRMLSNGRRNEGVTWAAHSSTVALQEAISGVLLAPSP